MDENKTLVALDIAGFLKALHECPVVDGRNVSKSKVAGLLAEHIQPLKENK